MYAWTFFRTILFNFFLFGLLQQQWWQRHAIRKKRKADILKADDFLTPFFFNILCIKSLYDYISCYNNEWNISETSCSYSPIFMTVIFVIFVIIMMECRTMREKIYLNRIFPYFSLASFYCWLGQHFFLFIVLLPYESILKSMKANDWGLCQNKNQFYPVNPIKFEYFFFTGHVLTFAEICFDFLEGITCGQC